jgi:hypothetical protein
MNVSSLSNIYSNFIQPILSKTLGVGYAGSAASASATAAAPQDSNQLSPFAQIATTLQDLQQQNPAQYQNVTKQIAANLQTAARTAQTGGNATLANQLTQLSTDFTNASQNNQLPDFQDLAQALSGGHHHHRQSDASSNDSSGIASLLSQFSSGSGANSANPASIIFSTLSTAGVSLT